MDNLGIMLLLFETPSGFALFNFSEGYYHLPNTLSDIWAKYTNPERASCVTMPLEFETFEDKSSAINVDTGVHERLVKMINRWYRPGMKLAVGKPEYKTIIESKLGIRCMYDQIVMEVMWGIQHLMHKLVPKEKAEVAKDDRFPMSLGLRKYLMVCGFHDVRPEMLNERILATARALFDCDVIFKKHHKFLFTARTLFHSVSGIDFACWDLLKLAAALKVVCFPEENNDFHEVLSKDELLKLKEEAPKYKGRVPWLHCMRAYDNISSAYQVRSEMIGLLEFLVKEAKAAYDNGKLHGESEQIPAEQAQVGIEATPLASVGDSKDEAKLLNEHSEQNEVNNIEKQVQVHANAGSGLPPTPPKSVSNSSPFYGEVLRRSSKLKTSPFYGKMPVRRSPRLISETVPMSPQEDTRKRRKKTPAS